MQVPTLFWLCLTFGLLLCNYSESVTMVTASGTGKHFKQHGIGKMSMNESCVIGLSHEEGAEISCGMKCYRSSGDCKMFATPAKNTEDVCLLIESPNLLPIGNWTIFGKTFNSI